MSSHSAKTPAAKPAAPKTADKANPIADGVNLLQGAKTTAAKPAHMDPNEIVRVYHLKNHGGSFLHTIPANPAVEGAEPVHYRLDPGGSADVPRFVADLWVSHAGFQQAPLVGFEPSSGPVRTDPKIAALEQKNSELEEANKSFDERLKGLESMLEEARKAGFKPKE